MPWDRKLQHEKRAAKRRLEKEERDNIQEAKPSFMITIDRKPTQFPWQAIREPHGQQVLDFPAWKAYKNIEEAKNMAREFMGFRLPKGVTKEKIIQIAKQVGFSDSTALINAGLAIILDIEPSRFIQWVTLAKSLNYSIGAFLQNIVDDWISERQAEEQIYGVPDRLEIFARDLLKDGKEGPPITGDIFKEARDAKHIKDKELEYAQSLIDNFERFGESVPEHERWVLIKHRMGRTWLESEEYKQWQEERIKDKADIEKLKKKYNLPESKVFWESEESQK